MTKEEKIGLLVVLVLLIIISFFIPPINKQIRNDWENQLRIEKEFSSKCELQREIPIGQMTIDCYKWFYSGH